MMLAGLAVRDQDVLELARLLRAVDFDDTAERLENAYDVECKILALTIPEREEILGGLEDCPDGLAELRGVLVREHECGGARGSHSRAYATRATRTVEPNPLSGAA